MALILVVWPHLKAFYLSKDISTRSVKGKKKKQTEGEVGRQYKRVDRV